MAASTTFDDNDEDEGGDGVVGGGGMGKLTPQTSPEIEAREGGGEVGGEGVGEVGGGAGWTPARADRLAYVQRMKWESQKRWSAGQEVWMKEVSSFPHFLFFRGGGLLPGTYASLVSCPVGVEGERLVGVG